MLVQSFIVLIAYVDLPWVPEVFFSCEAIECGRLSCFGIGLAEDTKKDLTETANRARKVTGTQGSSSIVP